MRIKGFSIQEKYSSQAKPVPIDNRNITILYSAVNSTGKTTLMRAILYTLGFNIPNTELIKFHNYEFKMQLSVLGEDYNIIRKGDLIKINDLDFDLPVQEDTVHSILFKTSNLELLHNILGVMYFDQEKGWTLLNRGSIIGQNRFRIEEFFRGLKDDNSEASYRILMNIRGLERRISTYKLMLNIADYQEQMESEDGNKLEYETYDETIDKQILLAEQQLSDVNQEIAFVERSIKNNEEFIKYIEKKHIYVQIEDKIIMVTKDVLYNYDQHTFVNDARLKDLIIRRNSLKKQIESLKESKNAQSLFDTLPSVDQHIIKSLSTVPTIAPDKVKTIIEQLESEKSKLQTTLTERTKSYNIWIDKVDRLVKEYAKELDIPNKYKIDLFTRKLKTKSGAILHKFVFIYKLAYIKVLSEKLGYPLPIFCDSPNGREVEEDTINKMFDILNRDFSEHQLIIASIHKYENKLPSANIITMNGTLFDAQRIDDNL